MRATNLFRNLLPRPIKDAVRPYVALYREQKSLRQRPSAAALAPSQCKVQPQRDDLPAIGRSGIYEVDPNSSEFQRILNEHWYYSIELKPGVFTRGYEFPNVMCTRELLARLVPSGLDVCDIGTMEGLIPVLLKRRGARSVVALDGIDLTERVQLVRVCTGQNFDYIPNVPLGRVTQVLSERARPTWWGTKLRRGFDVVVLSGVLYHVFSPFHAIGLARTLLRQRGLLILETAASDQDVYAQNWVFQGDRWIYPNGTNTWFPTLRLLDHFLRFMKLKTVDCVHKRDHADIVRVAVAAVATANPLPLKAESEWFIKSTMNLDYNDVVDTAWAEGDAIEIPYPSSNCVNHEELSTAVDLHRTVEGVPWPCR